MESKNKPTNQTNKKTELKDTENRLMVTRGINGRGMGEGS